jgi:DNA repair photolyase
MNLEFQEYRARKIVNVHKHVDGPWFWDKYSAHPYVGCRHGCEFCYQRGGVYLGKRDPETYHTLVGVKVNAVELLRKELTRLSPEIIVCGDWQQPAEDRYRLSRGMLEVVLEAGFPLFLIERSPLVSRDLDLLVEINRRAWVGVVLSMSSLDSAIEAAFEPRSPGVGQRLQVMRQLAEAGILVGTALMPIIPFLGDDERHLEEVVQATRQNGGRFVMAGGLTMAGVQADHTLAAACSIDPGLGTKLRQMYRWSPGGQPSYGPPVGYSARLGRTVRELCARHGLADRVPRYVAPGPLAVNKRIAERLFLKTYDLELEQAASYRVWAYRKAAWTVDELPESILGIWQEHGESGLSSLPSVGKGLARQIAGWLTELGA